MIDRVKLKLPLVRAKLTAEVEKPQRAVLQQEEINAWIVHPAPPGMTMYAWCATYLDRHGLVAERHGFATREEAREHARKKLPVLKHFVKRFSY